MKVEHSWARKNNCVFFFSSESEADLEDGAWTSGGVPSILILSAQQPSICENPSRHYAEENEKQEPSGRVHPRRLGDGNVGERVQRATTGRSREGSYGRYAHKKGEEIVTAA